MMASYLDHQADDSAFEDEQMDTEEILLALQRDTVIRDSGLIHIPASPRTYISMMLEVMDWFKKELTHDHRSRRTVRSTRPLGCASRRVNSAVIAKRSVGGPVHESPSKNPSLTGGWHSRWLFGTARPVLTCITLEGETCWRRRSARNREIYHDANWRQRLDPHVKGKDWAAIEPIGPVKSHSV